MTSIENLKNLEKTSYILEKTLILSLAVGATIKMKKIFKKEKSIEILKFLGLIENI